MPQQLRIAPTPSLAEIDEPFSFFPSPRGIHSDDCILNLLNEVEWLESDLNIASPPRDAKCAEFPWKQSLVKGRSSLYPNFVFVHSLQRLVDCVEKNDSFIINRPRDYTVKLHNPTTCTSSQNCQIMPFLIYISVSHSLYLNVVCLRLTQVHTT